MEKEVKLLSTYLEFFRGIQVVTTFHDLDSVINPLEYDQVVCFSLMTAENEDAQLEKMYTFLRTGNWKQEHLSTQSWYEGHGEGVLSVRLYDGGQPVELETPSRPGKPFATEISASDTSL